MQKVFGFLRFRKAEYFFRRSLLFDNAVRHKNNLVRNVTGESHFVRYDDHRSSVAFKTSPVSSGSRAEVGSSKQSISGFNASARAIATLCCCPPESSDGYEAVFSSSPTFFQSARASSSIFLSSFFLISAKSLRLSKYPLLSALSFSFSSFNLRFNARVGARVTFFSAVYCGKS